MQQSMGAPAMTSLGTAPRMVLHRPWGWGIALLLVVLLRWAPILFQQRQLGDESYYSTIATEMLHGARPYLDVVDRKPPLLYYTHWLALALVGEYNFVGLHAFALGWVLCTMALLGLAAAAMFGPRAGLAAAGLYGLSLPSYDYHDFSLNGEMLMNLPIAGALAIAVWPSRYLARPMLLVAGVLLAVAALLKQSALTAAPAIGLYVLLPGYRERHALRLWHSILHAVLLVCGFALGLGACALLLHEQGNLREAIAWTLWNNDVTNRPTEAAFWLLGARAFGLFVLSNLSLVVLCALALREGVGRGHRYFVGRSAELSLLLTLLATSIIGAAIPGRFFSHYLFQLLPALVLLAAPVAARLWEGTVAYRARAARQLFITLALTTGTLLVIHSVSLVLRRGPGPASLWVRRNSAPNDRIFAWTVSPDFYLDARRRPASRFIGTYALNGMQFGSPRRFDPTFDTSDRIVAGSWGVLRAELERAPPAFIIDGYSRLPVPVYTPKHFGLLSQLLERSYELAFDGPDAIVYRRVVRAGHSGILGAPSGP